MRLRKKFGWLAAAAAAVILLFAAGCTLPQSAQSSLEIDPPPADANIDPNPAVKPVNAADRPAEPQMEVTLYFKDANGFVAPLSVKIPKSENVAQKSLEYMVEGGPGEALLPKGFTALIPKGTQVKPLNIVADQKLAVVDFSPHFANYNPQDERKILEAITWTLTGFPTIDKVRIRLAGQDLKEMPVAGTPTDEPLTRAMGINLELVEGTDYGRTTPVTLYFQNRTADNFKYFVPVTRMIDRTDNVALAAVNELIRGPKQQSGGLAALIDPDTKLLGVQKENEVLTVNFDDRLLGPDNTARSDALQSVVLSLSENTGAEQVKIVVNGEAKVVADDKTNYSRPVSRPAHVNEIKM
jgi:germination protein M